MLTRKNKINILLVLIIGIIMAIVIFIIWRRVTVPKNIFEEIYSTELYRAKKEEDTVLSGTKYFEAEKALVKKLKSGGFIIREIPILHSPYELQIGYNTSGGGLHKEKSKNVIISISYVYQSIDFSVQYRYLFDGGGGDPSVTGEGLHVIWEATKNNETISSSGKLLDKANYDKTLQKWNISNSEIESKIKNELKIFFEIWFSVYEKSRFSKSDLGNFKEIT